jgi:hypothetical protein
MAQTPPVDVAAETRAALPTADYGDSFLVVTSASSTAEEWARAAFEPTPGRTVASQQRVWRGVLQLRLRPVPSPDHVAGWAVVDRRPERLVLGATSWHLEGRLVFEGEPDAARVTTLVRFRNPAGRAVWAVVAPLHRHAVPGILDAARRRLTG